MKKIYTFLFAFLGIFLFTSTVIASEGVTELRSTNGEAYRCFAVGQQMELNSYRTMVTCRDLVYPAADAPIRYIMWANPVSEGPLIKFGKLDFGRKLFTHARPYTSIFVTAENTAVDTPKGPIVMQGTTQPIAALDFPTSPTPTPEEQVEEVITEKVSPTEAPSTKKKTTSALKTVSLIIAVVLLVGTVTALVLIQRSKKR